jgi:hypothetical protein
MVNKINSLYRKKPNLYRSGNEYIDQVLNKYNDILTDISNVFKSIFGCKIDEVKLPKDIEVGSITAISSKAHIYENDIVTACRIIGDVNLAQNWFSEMGLLNINKNVRIA